MSNEQNAEPTEPVRIKGIEIPVAEQSPLVLALVAIIAKRNAPPGSDAGFGNAPLGSDAGFAGMLRWGQTRDSGLDEETDRTKKRFPVPK
jgi:hypothetical protein